MAKGTRAKSVIRHKRVKYLKVFKAADDARVKRLAERLKTEPKYSHNVPKEDVEMHEGKISTHGWKGSRNEEWRLKKKSKASIRKRKGNSALVFPRGRLSK